MTSRLVDEYIYNGMQLPNIIREQKLSVDELRRLLQKRPRLSSSDGYYGLCFAASINRLDYVQLLLDEFGVDVNSHPDGEGFTALCEVAAKGNMTQMVRFLIERGANVHLKCTWFGGRSPLEQYPDVVGPVWREFQMGGGGAIPAAEQVPIADEIIQDANHIYALRKELEEADRSIQPKPRSPQLPVAAGPNAAAASSEASFTPMCQSVGHHLGCPLVPKSKDNKTIDKMSVQDVCHWLTTVVPSAEAAARYAEAFKLNEISGLALRELTEADLRDSLGITILGHRKAILAKVKSMVNDQQQAAASVAAMSGAY